MPEGLNYQMTVTEISRNGEGYDVKAEVEERLYSHNAIRFVVLREHIRLFPIGESVSVTVSFGLPALSGK